ncbi:MAG: DUF4430 domain-containing protein [Sarcina sp.]
MNRKLIIGISISSFLIAILLLTAYIFNVQVDTTLVQNTSAPVSINNNIEKDTKKIPNVKAETPNSSQTPLDNSDNKNNVSTDKGITDNSNGSSTNTSDKNSNTNSTSANENSTSNETIKPKKYITVNLSGPSNNFIGSYQVEVTKNNLSVYDATNEAFTKNNISMQSRGTGMTRYVYSINGISEFDHGGSSGWMYKVNGRFPNKSCDAFDIKTNDIIEWVYTLDGGLDVGAR